MYSESLTRACGGGRSGVLNILKGLNNEVLTKGPNMPRSAKLSGFIGEYEFHFAEELFNSKGVIHCISTTC